MGLLCGAILSLLLFAFIFWPSKNASRQADTSRIDSLRERRDAIYENLRDLNFENLAGKYPEEDFIEQRTNLEDEAARVMAEMKALGAR